MLPPLEQLEVYCINLDRRPDRWSHAQAAWAKLGCPAEHLHRVQAIDTQSYVGCARSHQKCVSLAQEAGLPFICVVEDDVDFRPNAAKIYESLRQKLPENCSILYGGVSWAGSAEAEIVPGIRALGECAGLFCVFYFASAYEAVLAWQQGDGNIDRFLGHREDITRMVAIPYLAGTTSGHSDLRKRQTRDADLIERVERKFLDSDPGKSIENVIALENPMRRGNSLKVSRAMYARGPIGLPVQTVYGTRFTDASSSQHPYSANQEPPKPLSRSGSLPAVEQALIQQANARRSLQPGVPTTSAVEEALIQAANQRRSAVSVQPATPAVEKALMQAASQRSLAPVLQSAPPEMEQALIRSASERGSRPALPQGALEGVAAAGQAEKVEPSAEMQEAIRQAAAQLRRELGMQQSQTS